MSVADAIRERMANAGIQVAAEDTAALAEYIGLLTKWNQTINLTALDLKNATDKAIDKLLVEPFAAVRILRMGDSAGAAPQQSAGPGPSETSVPLRLLDVGSGGGSPAIPLKLALGQGVELHMVESKTRKAAFLREAIRHLSLRRSEVHNKRFEELPSSPEMREAFDLVSIRAVRADLDLWKALSTLLKPGGLVLWFRSAGEAGSVSAPSPGFLLQVVEPLIPGTTGELAVLKRL